MFSLGSRSLLPTTTLHISRRMMSSVYVIPLDPKAPKASSVEGLDAAKLWSSIPQTSKPAKAGTAHTFYGTPSGSQNITTLTSLGPTFSKSSTPPSTKRELVRTAVGSAVQQVKGLGEGVNGREVAVDVAGDGQAAAVAAHLALYKFSLKTEPPSPFNPNNQSQIPPRLSFTPLDASSPQKTAWEEGVVYAEAQNLARTLMELPANMLTPTLFARRIQQEFSGVAGVEIIVRDTGKCSMRCPMRFSYTATEWAAEKGMNSFLSVTHGTSEPAKLLEMYVCTLESCPIDLIGFFQSLSWICGQERDPARLRRQGYHLRQWRHQLEAWLGHEAHAWRHGWCSHCLCVRTGHRQAEAAHQPVSGRGAH